MDIIILLFIHYIEVMLIKNLMSFTVTQSMVLCPKVILGQLELM